MQLEEIIDMLKRSGVTRLNLEIEFSQESAEQLESESSKPLNNPSIRISARPEPVIPAEMLTGEY